MLECKPIIIGLIVGSGSPRLVKFGGGGCGGVESHAKSKYRQTRSRWAAELRCKVGDRYIMVVGFHTQRMFFVYYR